MTAITFFRYSLLAIRSSLFAPRYSLLAIRSSLFAFTTVPYMPVVVKNV